jgi:hypothetical protein
MGKYYLSTYRPLIHNQVGKEACRRFGHPPFVDSSCRREPDLESEYPSITAICHGRMFAPRLQVGDRVIYMTIKGSAARGLRHIVTALEVVRRFECHADAAAWYRSKGLKPPSNCVVSGNPPLGLAHTDHGGSKHGNVTCWDAIYQRRASRYGVFLVCKPLRRIDLHNPPAITDADLINIFGRVPATRTPPDVKETEFAALLAFLKRHGSPQR